SLAERFYRSSIYKHSFYSCVWKTLLNLCMDPVESVAVNARKVVDAVNVRMISAFPDRVAEFLPARIQSPTLLSPTSTPAPTESLRRTGSIGNSLRTMFGTRSVEHSPSMGSESSQSSESPHRRTGEFRVPLGLKMTSTSSPSPKRSSSSHRHRGEDGDSAA